MNFRHSSQYCNVSKQLCTKMIFLKNCFKTTFTLLRSGIMPVKFTCVYTTPLQFCNLFTSTHAYKPTIFLTKQRNLNKKHSSLLFCDLRCFIYKRHQKLTAFLFTRRRVALRFRSTTFRKRSRVATAKVTFSIS